MKICIRAEKGTATTHWEATYANARQEKDLTVQSLDANLCILQLKNWLLVSIVYVNSSSLYILSSTSCNRNENILPPSHNVGRF